MINRQFGPLAVVFVSLAACGGGEPVKQAPALVAEAYQWNQRAESAFRRGDHQAALDASRRALELYRSLEDSDGVARELANLSSIHHARGEHGEALAMLAPILSDGRIPFQSRHRVEAAYRAAVITAPGHPREAGEWLDRAEQYCHSDCEAQGRILNLRARLRLGEKRTGEAQTLARRALSLHEKRADRQEMANSLRLLGDIALASANPAEARAHYQRALETDKDEAIPHKIFADLMGIGRSLAVEGRREEAATYFRRARDVADAAGQNAAVIEADIQIKRDGY